MSLPQGKAENTNGEQKQIQSLLHGAYSPGGGGEAFIKQSPNKCKIIIEESTTIERNTEPRKHIVGPWPGQWKTVMTAELTRWREAVDGGGKKPFQQRQQHMKSTSGRKEHSRFDFFLTQIPNFPKISISNVRKKNPTCRLKVCLIKHTYLWKQYIFALHRVTPPQMYFWQKMQS